MKRIDNIQHGQELAKQAQEYNENIKLLKQQKAQLEEQLSLEKDKLIIENMGSSIVLLADTNENHLNDTIPTLNSYGYVGVIAIDDNISPLDNIDGYLNIDDINELVQKGYELVLTIDCNSNIKDLYNKYKEYFDIKGFYCPKKDITNSQIKDIKQIGLNTVITYDGVMLDEDIFSITSIGSYDKNAKAIFDDGLKISQISAFSIGYSNSNEMYLKSNVDSMLERMNKAQTANKTLVTNITGAKLRYQEYLDTLELLEYKQITNNINDLENRIENINKQIIKLK